MPTGEPYFAWIDPTETVFGPEHMRWDESVFSFHIEQNEGDPASMTVVVRRPRNSSGNPIGLLGPGRKIWAWFALDCGPSLFRFRGRLVGVPTSIFEELVTLEFVARPFDVVAQKNVLADSLRVLPFYDEVVLDETRRTDPEVVLEGYSKIWAYDRETHLLSVSDEIDGEDGLVEFDGASEDGKVFYDGLGLTLTSGPLARVDVVAEYTWTQQAYGTVDMTRYLTEGDWAASRGVIASFTLTADSWPKNGAGIGDGWTVAEASAEEVFDLTVTTKTSGGQTTYQWWDGDTTTISTNESITGMLIPGGSIIYEMILTEATLDVSYDSDGKVTGTSGSQTGVPAVLPLHHIRPTLLAAFTAARPCTEVVSLTLFADVQHILTDPEDGEALRIDDVKSVNLSVPIDGEVPIGDPRRRSYIATERGNRSVEHLIALARAQLLKRARVVEITVAPKLSRMPEITLRKNAFVIEPRIGEATGKVIGYSVALDGADGHVRCEIKIGCTIGRGGSAVASGGAPTYCSEDYVGADYQQYTGRTILFDTSVGYQPPLANPNDDGLNFLAPVTAEDAIDTPLVVTNNPTEQRAIIEFARLGFTNPPAFLGDVSGDPSVPPEIGNPWSAEKRQEMVQARSESVNNALKKCETKATFKLKSMSREFSTPYEIQVTDLKVPTGYNLEAV